MGTLHFAGGIPRTALAAGAGATAFLPPMAPAATAVAAATSRYTSATVARAFASVQSAARAELVARAWAAANTAPADALLSPDEGLVFGQLLVGYAATQQGSAIILKAKLEALDINKLVSLLTTTSAGI